MLKCTDPLYNYWSQVIFEIISIFFVMQTKSVCHGRHVPAAAVQDP
jgi:hypothetical protein